MASDRDVGTLDHAMLRYSHFVCVHCEHGFNALFKPEVRLAICPQCRRPNALCQLTPWNEPATK